MPSPFPGMDPYLEDAALWPAFHHQLVMCLYQILLPGLADRYRARIGQRRYRVEPSPEAPQEERQEDFLEIRQRSDGKLLTLVDVVSPANKTTASGRAAFLDQRREAKNAGASIVEIDLVLQGQPTLEYSRDGLPDWDYAVTTTRSTQAERYEIYTATLQKRLPRFRLALASDDRDLVCDLHTAFTRCYDQGGFASQIDYTRDPSTPLSEEDRRWLQEVLKQQRPRVCVPSEEEIARAAYFLWEQEGRPHGRDKEHWRRAQEQLSP
ncbi:MAG TPA: DUF4058 family protein [Gemmataceae bacterium]|nr:DUF4058 family protein [Gemmataceae bacterium]